MNVKTQKKILVVEDYADSRDFMKLLLENSGYLVCEAGDGEAAVLSVSVECPDLVLMDISLPFMDGLTATRMIRQSECGKKTPIIAVTAYGTSFMVEAIKAGCDDLIPKPVDLEILEPMIERYLALAP